MAVRPSSPAAPVEVHAAVAPLEGDWDALAERVGAPPFLRAGWIAAWWEAFGAGELEVLAVRRDGRLTGVLPLGRRRGVVQSPANWHTPVFGMLADSEADAAALSAGLLARPARRYDLSFLDPDLRGLSEVRAAAREAGCRIIERPVARSPYVDAEAGWDAYRATLSAKRRKEVERVRRRLAEEGRLEFVFEEDATHLEDGLRIEGSGWKLERGTAIASDPAVHRFYTTVAEWAARHDWLRLAFLRLDGEPIAFDFCLHAGGAAYVMKGGYDERYRRFGPGMLLTYEEIAHAFEAGMRAYEFCGADEAYKTAWTRTVRERVRLQAFPRTPAGWADHLAWTHGRPLALRLRQRVARGRGD